MRMAWPMAACSHSPLRTTATGKISFSALDGTERMTSDQFATVVAVEHIDALGRVAQCMRRAGESLAGLTSSRARRGFGASHRQARRPGGFQRRVRGLI